MTRFGHFFVHEIHVLALTLSKCMKNMHKVLTSFWLVLTMSVRKVFFVDLCSPQFRFTITIHCTARVKYITVCSLQSAHDLGICYYQKQCSMCETSSVLCGHACRADTSNNRCGLFQLVWSQAWTCERLTKEETWTLETDRLANV